MTVEVDLPEPHEGQIKVLKSKARFKVLMCGRRWGKSLISQVISVKGGLAKKRTAYITPEFSLAKEFFQEILDMLPPEIIAKVNKSELTIRFVTGGYLRFFSGEALRSMRGLKFHTVIIDEAAHIPDLENAWLNVIRPTLTDYQGNALFISTPRGRGFFFTLFLKGKNKEAGYESFHFTSYDNPYVSNAEIDAAKEEIPKAAFKQEYLAIAAANAAAAVELEDIEKGTILELSDKPTVCFGIDVAKYADFTVIAGVDEDGKQTYYESLQKNNELTKEAIRRLPEDVLKVMDSTHGSLGDGILEALLLEGVPNLIGFEFTAVSKPKLITELILDIERGDCKFNKETADELSIFEYKIGRTGHISYGNAPGGHDDRVIALALANKFRKQAYGDFSDSFDSAA